MNFVDGILIGMILIIVVAGVFYFSREKESSNLVIGKQRLTFIVRSEGIGKEVAEAYHVGDQMVSGERYQKGAITHVQVTPEKELVATDGEIVAREIANSFQVWVTIEAEVNQYGPYRDFGGQSVKVGEIYAINTKDVRSNGHVVYIETQEVEK